MTSRSATTEQVKLRQYGLMMGGVIAVLFAGIVPLVRSSAVPAWPLILAGAFAAAALARPLSLKIVYDAWMRFGHVMGRINGAIILTVVYAIMILPIGLALRLVRKDPLSLAWDKNAKTYKSYLGSGIGLPDLKRMERPF